MTKSKAVIASDLINVIRGQCASALEQSNYKQALAASEVNVEELVLWADEETKEKLNIR